MQAIVAFYIFHSAAFVAPTLAHHGFAITALYQGFYFYARATKMFIFIRKHSQLFWIQRFRLLLAV